MSLLYLSADELLRVRQEAASSTAVQKLVEDEQAASVQAAMWALTGRHPTRVLLASRIMFGGLLVQAAYLGLVRCALCGDRGCSACAAC